jgi:hypothetical protein
MNVERMQDYSRQLVALYTELIGAAEGYAHDPQAHNLCLAVCEFSTGVEEYLSYSNPSALKAKALKYFRSSLIPYEPSPNNALVSRAGPSGQVPMQDLHTEVRLINYLHSIGRLARAGSVTMFSTRTVCPTCRQAIYDTQKATALTCSFGAIELEAEKPDSTLEHAFSFNVPQPFTPNPAWVPGAPAAVSRYLARPAGQESGREARAPGDTGVHFS